MKKILTITILSFISLQKVEASFADLTPNHTPVSATWRKIDKERDTRRKKVFDILKENGNYEKLAELKEALDRVDQKMAMAFQDKLNTSDEDTYQLTKETLDQEEKDLLRAAEDVIPAYENPPAYEEPTVPNYSEENWNTLPTYEEEDWSDTGWIKVGNKDLEGYPESSEYEQYLRDQYLND